MIAVSSPGGPLWGGHSKGLLLVSLGELRGTCAMLKWVGLCMTDSISNQATIWISCSFLASSK